VLGPFLVIVGREETDMPLAVEFLEAHKADPGIEEQIEFLHAHVENLCEREMPQLVNQHEKRQGKYQLNGLYHSNLTI
jgi:hypothetical protein